MSGTTAVSTGVSGASRAPGTALAGRRALSTHAHSSASGGACTDADDVADDDEEEEMPGAAPTGEVRVATVTLSSVSVPVVPAR